MGQWLSNVAINDGLHHLYIEQGCISRIVPHTWEIPDLQRVWDAQGLLLLPTFEDYHVHLDKQFPVHRWISRRRVGTILEQFQLEKELLSPFKDGLLDRARHTLEQMLACGTTRARVHVDMDPEIGLSHLHAMVQLKAEYRGRVEIEVAAFPQQGLLRSGSVSLLKQALREGATIVGCVDPAGVDRNVEACLHAVFDMSVEFGAEVDIHLHDPGHLGLYTSERISDFTEQAGKQGKVAISHAYGLGGIDERSAAQIAMRLAEQRIAIITSVPIDSAMPRVDQLTAYGVKVKLGTDHTGLDAWTPFGSPDLFARGRRLAEKYIWNDDERLRSIYAYVSSTPLRFEEGAIADFVLIDAVNPEHAAATSPPRELVVVRGRPVAGRRIASAWQAQEEMEKGETR